jgi:hypothetical protein
MSKRLQVLLEEAEFREIKRLARSQRLSVAAWVRQALRSARAPDVAGPAQKLEVIRAAARHAFPTAEIDEMLAQIERGYLRSSGA